MSSLVEYSSSEGSDNERPPPKRQKTSRFKPESQTTHSQHPSSTSRLPNTLKESSIVSSSCPFDDPSHHEGRIRSIKHERGNWATFAYILLPENESLTALQDSIIESEPSMELKKLDEFHISLTRTVMIRHHWIDSFVESIRKRLEGYRKFSISLDCFEIYTNDERTRTFIGIRTEEEQSLRGLVKIMDECLEEFKLPTYYAEPSFHTSILWCLGDRREELSRVRYRYDELLSRIRRENDEDFSFSVEEILCKCGNRQYDFALAGK